MAEQATVVIRVNSDQAEEAIEDLNDELNETTLKAARAGEAVDDVAGEGAATSIRVVGEAAEEAGEGFDSMGTRSRSAKRAVLGMADEAGQAALAFTSLSSSAQVVLGTLVGGGAAVAGGVGLAGAATMLSREFGSAGIRGEIELLESQLKATLENALKPWEGLIRGEVIPSVRQGAKAVASWSDELASFSGLMVDVAQTLETPIDVLLPLEVFNEKDRKALRNLDRITKEQLNELGNARSQGQGQQGRPKALPPDSLTSPAERAAGVGAVAVSTQGTREVLPEEATGPSEKELKEKRQDIFKKVLDPLQRKIQVINSLPFLSKEEKLKRKRDVLRKIVRQLVKTDKKLTETQDLPNIVKETKINEFSRKLRAARRQLNRLKGKNALTVSAKQAAQNRAVVDRFFQQGGRRKPLVPVPQLGPALGRTPTIGGTMLQSGPPPMAQALKAGRKLGALPQRQTLQGILGGQSQTPRQPQGLQALGMSLDEIQQKFNVSKKKAEQFKQVAKSRFGQVAQAATSMGSALVSALQGGKKEAEDIASILLKGVGGVLSAIPGVGQIAGPVLSGLGGLVGSFQHGGRVDTPLQVVGEAGPEMVSLPMGTQVHNAPDTKQLMQEMQSGGGESDAVVREIRRLGDRIQGMEVRLDSFEVRTELSNADSELQDTGVTEYTDR